MGCSEPLAIVDEPLGIPLSVGDAVALHRGSVCNVLTDHPPARPRQVTASQLAFAHSTGRRR